MFIRLTVVCVWLIFLRYCPCQPLLCHRRLFHSGVTPIPSLCLSPALGSPLPPHHSLHQTCTEWCYTYSVPPCLPELIALIPHQERHACYLFQHISGHSSSSFSLLY